MRGHGYVVAQLAVDVGRLRNASSANRGSETQWNPKKSSSLKRAS